MPVRVEGARISAGHGGPTPAAAITLAAIATAVAARTPAAAATRAAVATVAALSVVALAGGCARARRAPVRPVPLPAAIRGDTMAQPAAFYPFFRVEPSTPVEPDHFAFQVDGRRYVVPGTRPPPRAGDAIVLHVPAERGFVVEQLQVAPYEGDLLLLAQLTNFDEGYGTLVRVAPRQQAIRWRARIPTINLGMPAVRRGYAYITGLGYVAKVDLRTGRFAWRHEDLYRRGRFNAFQPPHFNERVVYFYDIDAPAGAAAVVRVDDRDGHLIRTEAGRTQ